MARDETNPVARAVRAAREELAGVDADRPDEALPRLRAAQEHLVVALDEAMAVAVVEGSSLRSTGALAGLSENAVGPRLARTNLLRAYGDDTGRVTANAVVRARYDIEQGRHRDDPAADAGAAKPMRFRARRSSD